MSRLHPPLKSIFETISPPGDNRGDCRVIEAPAEWRSVRQQEENGYSSTMVVNPGFFFRSTFLPAMLASLFFVFVASKSKKKEKQSDSISIETLEPIINFYLVGGLIQERTRVSEI